MQKCKIYDTDTTAEIAAKIFDEFEVDQSCTVMGYVMVNDLLEAKGELVCDAIRKLDELKNIRPYGKKMTRIRTRKPNTIGDYVAHKTFQWDKKVVDNKMRYVIWRIQ